MPIKQFCDECQQKFTPAEGWRFSFCPACQRRYGDRQRRRPASYVDSKDFLQSEQWRTLRIRVGELAGWKCARCLAHGFVNANLSHPIDHIAPRQVRPDLATTEANLQVLCASCHNSKSRNEQHGMVIDWLVDTAMPVVMGGTVTDRVMQSISKRKMQGVPKPFVENGAIVIGNIILFGQVDKAFTYARKLSLNVFTVMT